MAQSTAASVINRHRTQSADQPAIINNLPVNITKNPGRSFPGHPHLLLKGQSKNISEGNHYLSHLHSSKKYQFVELSIHNHDK